MCAFCSPNIAACSCIDLLLAIITCRFISGDEISYLFVTVCVSIMADGDTRLRQDLGMPKYKALASMIQRKAELEKCLRAVRPAIEETDLGFLSERSLQLDASNGQGVSGWIFSKSEQLARSDYPYYTDEFDDRNLSIPGAKKDNSQWNLCYDWLQTTL